jgi:ribosome-associated heat shock protein Hsp15
MNQSVRIDKWLWSARIYKTRTLATEACRKGQVSIAGVKVKPSRMVTEGEILNVRKNPLTLPFQSFSILLFLIGVPFSLRWFHHKTRAIRLEKALKERLPAYRKAASARMYVFSLIALFALFLEVFTTMPNALVFFLMTMLFFLFCIPVKGQVIKDLELFPNPEQAQETEEQPSEQASERPK